MLTMWSEHASKRLTEEFCLMNIYLKCQGLFLEKDGYLYLYQVIAYRLDLELTFKIEIKQ